MPLYLSHDCSLRFWRAARTARVSLSRFRFTRTFENTMPAKQEIVSAIRAINETPPRVFNESDSPELVFLRNIAPLHLLVSSKELRPRQSTAHIVHVWQKNVPGKAFANMGHDCLVSSPEFTFLQHAAKADMLDLALLAMEWCGGYSTNDAANKSENPCESTSQTTFDLQPITTPRRLMSALAECPGIPGAKKARQALTCIVPNSQSPMESRLFLLLCLPSAFGGFALPRPLLNKKMSIGNRSKAAASKSFYVCDFYWPDAKLVIEYDSNAHHVGPKHIAADAAKRNALSFMGVEVITVTTAQILDLNSIEKIATIVAKKLGFRLRIRRKDHLQKRLLLHNKLFREQ